MRVLPKICHDEVSKKGGDAAATHYVKNADLRAELIKSKELDELTPEAVRMIQEIANKLSNRLRYENPDDKADCIAYAIMDCMCYWRNYDPSISDNAFAYITSMCRNGFAKGWRALGYMKMPQSTRLYLSDNIYSI